MSIDVVAIVGPTGSGKSELAEELALSLKTEIVSVDAMQLYCGLDIGTAKIPLKDRRVALHMVDVCEPTENYSVQLYQEAARNCIDELRAQSMLPILCGGTGLYLNAVIDEMNFPQGERTSERRNYYEALAQEEGAEALYERLCERDPKSAELIHPNNTRRVIRALELFDEGVSYAAHHEGLHKRKSYYTASLWGLSLPRELLYSRLDQRVEDMFAQGLVEEVEKLRSQGLTGELTAGQAIGYKEILDALEGRLSLDEAKGLIKQRTRHYAKRQLSWFGTDTRIQWLDMSTITTSEALARIVEDIYGTCNALSN